MPASFLAGTTATITVIAKLITERLWLKRIDSLKSCIFNQISGNSARRFRVTVQEDFE